MPAHLALDTTPRLMRTTPGLGPAQPRPRLMKRAISMNGSCLESLRMQVRGSHRPRDATSDCSGLPVPILWCLISLFHLVIHAVVQDPPRTVCPGRSGSCLQEILSVQVIQRAALCTALTSMHSSPHAAATQQQPTGCVGIHQIFQILFSAMPAAPIQPIICMFPAGWLVCGVSTHLWTGDSAGHLLLRRETAGFRARQTFQTLARSSRRTHARGAW